MSQLYMKEDCDFLIRDSKIVTIEENNYEDIKLRVLHRIQSNLFDWIFKKKITLQFLQQIWLNLLVAK